MFGIVVIKKFYTFFIDYIGIIPIISLIFLDKIYSLLISSQNKANKKAIAKDLISGVAYRM